VTFVRSLQRNLHRFLNLTAFSWQDTDKKFFFIFEISGNSRMENGTLSDLILYTNYQGRPAGLFYSEYVITIMRTSNESVSKSFRTDRLERELQVVQLFAIRCSCIAILWVSLVSFAAITICVASQWVFIVVIVVYFVMTQSGNFWIHPSTYV
jgi:hypothetical protein